MYVYSNTIPDILIKIELEGLPSKSLLQNIYEDVDDQGKITLKFDCFLPSKCYFI